MSKLNDAKRVVVKVGTSTLTHKTGMLNIRRIETLVKVLSDLKNAGKEIVLVTSGAIGIGAGKLSFDKRPDDMPTKQACAALGQSELMYVYDKYFGEYNHNAAQILLTRDILEDEPRKQNVINTFKRLLELKVIPIVNENDTVSTEEIEFGDNDTLSAIVSVLIEADLLIVMTDIDGLYDKDPRNDSSAKLIEKVEVIDEKMLGSAKGNGSTFSTGGMITKLHAAQLCMENDIPMYIINGKDPKNLYRLKDGQSIGTLFCNVKEKV